eukprot:scaffold24929_cov235-Cylindrotheca_fusiformis.AAC.1
MLFVGEGASPGGIPTCDCRISVDGRTPGSTLVVHTVLGCVGGGELVHGPKWLQCLRVGNCCGPSTGRGQRSEKGLVPSDSRSRVWCGRGSCSRLNATAGLWTARKALMICRNPGSTWWGLKVAESCVRSVSCIATRSGCGQLRRCSSSSSEPHCAGQSGDGSNFHLCWRCRSGKRWLTQRMQKCCRSSGAKFCEKRCQSICEQWEGSQLWVRQRHSICVLSLECGRCAQQCSRIARGMESVTVVCARVRAALESGRKGTRGNSSCWWDVKWTVAIASQVELICTFQGSGPVMASSWWLLMCSDRKVAEESA